MKKKNCASVRIMDALMGKDSSEPNPRSKVWCPVHGDYAEYRDFAPEFGACRSAQREYGAEQRPSNRYAAVRG